MIECAKEEYGERSGLSKEQRETAREAASNIFNQYLGEDVNIFGIVCKFEAIFFEIIFVFRL